MKRTKNIVTHSGIFHADEIVACVIEALLRESRGESYEIIRSRDPQILNHADMLIDVGGVYAPENDLYDHHQGKVGERPGGIWYASAGLLWKHKGYHLLDALTEALDLPNEAVVRIYEKVDRNMIIAIDMNDNGVAPVPFGISLSALVTNMNALEGEDQYTQFMEAFRFVKFHFHRYILKLVKEEEDFAKIGVFDEGKAVLVLPKFYVWKEYVKTAPHIKRVVSFDERQNRWIAQSVSSPKNMFESLYPFPEKWAGLSDNELEAVTNVKGSRFCHLKRFLVVNDTKEGAIEMAYACL